MKEYKTDQIRNVALISHNGAGKTTFVERLLFNTNVITRMGSVQSGTAAMDFEEEEVARNSSIATALAPIEWEGLKFNILDTPGYVDFIGEVNSALRVVETAVVFVEAVSGVEVGTEIVWQAAGELNLPRIIVVNKMDRDTVRFARVRASIDDNLTGNFVNFQLPIGERDSFRGIIDLLTMEAVMGDGERGPIPDDMVDAAEEARMELIEAAAESNDDLLEKYFEEDTLTDEELLQGLREGFNAGSLNPILYSAPEPGIAVASVMQALSQLAPAPNQREPFTVKAEDGEEMSCEVSDDSPLAAFVFKTREDPYGKMSYLRVFGGVLDSDSRVWAAGHTNAEVRVGSLQILRGKDQIGVSKLHSGDIGIVVKMGDAITNDTICQPNHKLQIAPIAQPNPIYSVAIHPITQSDTAKLSQSLARLVVEDPTLHWHTEKATRQTILSGMGTTHLAIAVKKTQSKFGLGLSTSIPKIPYRETITQTNSADYTHKKQTGGAGQYARIFLRVESVDDDEEFVFASEIFGGSVSAPFVAATEKGCRQALEGGVLAGYPVTGVKAIVYDGKEHPVDSKEIAFQTAGREGFKKAVMGAAPVMLEPIYEVMVTVPSDNMGDILGDMNTRRARVLGMDQEGIKSVVKAEVPLAEMQSYLADLRSMTQGRGVFSMKFLHYGRVPAHLLDSLVTKLRKESEEES